jgi:hypothetical protein
MKNSILYILLGTFLFVQSCRNEEKNQQCLHEHEKKDFANNVSHYLLKLITCEFDLKDDIFILYTQGPTQYKFVVFNGKKSKGIIIDLFSNDIRNLKRREMQCVKNFNISNAHLIMNKKDLFPERLISSYTLIGFAKYSKCESRVES